MARTCTPSGPYCTGIVDRFSVAAPSTTPLSRVGIAPGHRPLISPNRLGTQNLVLAKNVSSQSTNAPRQVPPPVNTAKREAHRHPSDMQCTPPLAPLAIIGPLTGTVVCMLTER